MPILGQIRASMDAQSPVLCVYKGLNREICVHAIGTKNGRQKVMAYQFGGESSKGLPEGGEWRCLFVDDIESIVEIPGVWHTRDDHSRPNTCIDEVEFEVIA